MWSLITLIVANRIQSTEQKTQNLENKVFVGLGSCDNVQTEKTIFEDEKKKDLLFRKK